nr:PTS sugar transporter subunit IIC [Texcoconibacillus texcoconensis]
MKGGVQVKAFLQRKGINPSLHTYVVRSLSFMALGLFSSLIIGLIIETTGQQLSLPSVEEVGVLAMSMTGPAIGVAIAYGLKAPPLVLFAAAIAGAAGEDLGGPAGSYITALIATECGKMVSKETRIDIIVTPLTTITVGSVIAAFIGPNVESGMRSFGQLVMWATDQQPIIMGVLVATLMGLALTAPISSAAIAIMLELEGVAAGVATVGCTAQMVGFAISSFRENGVSGLLSLGIGTSMLQIANVVKNPLILIPPTVAGAVVAPFATTVFVMENNPAGAGMGSSGFVGQIMTFQTMGFHIDVALAVLFFHFLIPAIVSLPLAIWMRKKQWIRDGDMRIQQ